MMSMVYMICVVISIGNLIYLSQKNYKNTDRYLWALVLLIPIVILGYWVKSKVHTPEGALVSFCFIYLDSTVFPVMLLLSLLKSIGKEPGPWTKITAYVITFVHLFSIWGSMDTKLYYKEIMLEETDLGTITKMISGPLKMSHYIFLAILAILFLAILIWGFLKKGTSSNRSFTLYSVYSIGMLLIYTAEMGHNANFSMLPVMYALGSVIISVNYENAQSHDIFNLIGEKQSRTSKRGFCAFDLTRHMLGYNEQFAEMIPDIRKIVIDEKIPREYTPLFNYVNNALDAFSKSGAYSEKTEIGDKIFLFVVSEFSVSHSKRRNGYLLEVSDITEEQKRIDTIEKYNVRLSEEVEKKTEHILGIQNSVVLGLANMVENRDFNTGGHVKRTSEVIQFLVDEIRRQGIYDIDIEKGKDIVRAAPMHDLGKISIDSDVLCKPGKLTDEEYKLMQSHAIKSGEIVKIILEGVEEQHFVDVSYNVARYHHERWDGKGYPDGLLGESIPVEARIMAVADVYDALVSKRCYKDALSFDEAFKMMNKNMGSHFDPAMRPVFVACREKLEHYYSMDS